MLSSSRDSNGERSLRSNSKGDLKTLASREGPPAMTKLKRFPSNVREKGRIVRVLVLGQAAVGKTALTVRFITRRFIGEYDPTLEKIYSFRTEIDDEPISFEILDTAGPDADSINLRLEENIRWADAYLLVYSVTDKCSFDECTRLKFLITHLRRRRKLSYGNVVAHPVILVGNKTDQIDDRMVSTEEGRRRSLELGCNGYHEISVRESYEESRMVFSDLFENWRCGKQSPRIIRTNTDTEEPRHSIATVQLQGIIGSFRRRSPTQKNTSPKESPESEKETKESRPKLETGLISVLKRGAKDEALTVPSVASSPQRRMSVSVQGRSSSLSQEVCG